MITITVPSGGGQMGGGGSGGRIERTWVPATETRTDGTAGWWVTLTGPGGGARVRCEAMTARATRCRGKVAGCITESSYGQGIETHHVCRRHYFKQPRGWW